MVAAQRQAGRSMGEARGPRNNHAIFNKAVKNILSRKASSGTHAEKRGSTEASTGPCLLLCHSQQLQKGTSLHTY